MAVDQEKRLRLFKRFFEQLISLLRALYSAPPGKRSAGVNQRPEEPKSATWRLQEVESAIKARKEERLNLRTASRLPRGAKGEAGEVREDL